MYFYYSYFVNKEEWKDWHFFKLCIKRDAETAWDNDHDLRNMHIENLMYVF